MSNAKVSAIRYLAIDPSVNYVGWASWDSHFKLFDAGMLDLSNWDSLQYKATELAGFCFRINPQVFIYEEATFQTSTKGKIAAQKGYTINLGYIAGFVAGTLHLNAADIYGYTPMQWKGNVPKKATDAKFRRYLNKGYIKYVSNYHHIRPTDHEVDATMILVHHLEDIGAICTR